MIIKFLFYILLIIGAVFLYVRYFESRNVFFPDKVIELNPSSIKLAFEDVHINTSDKVNIHGWFIPYPGAKYTLLFLHGNAGNISYRLDKVAFLNRIGLNILIIDYRGYGLSSGKPTEQGVYSDAKAACQYLAKNQNIDPQNIVLYGESLGSAVAVDLAGDVKVAGLILEGAFSRGRDVGKITHPYLPVLLVSNLFDSLGKIQKVDEPKLFIHSRDDGVIPIDLGRRLYDAAPGPKQFLEVGGGHTTSFIDSREKYSRSVLEFIENLK
jgi:fermentation-respiration switch protein FrsA (DUF1100 family)